MDLLQALRAQPAYSAVRAVACTAYALKADRTRFLEAGFDAYVSKPFTKDQITEALRRMLGQTSAASAARGAADQPAADRPAYGRTEWESPVQGGTIRQRFT